MGDELLELKSVIRDLLLDGRRSSYKRRYIFLAFDISTKPFKIAGKSSGVRIFFVYYL
jgi:hypothetical protein